MAKKIDIAGTLNAATTDGVLGFSEQIKDESKGKMQSSLNKEFGEGIDRIERKSDIAYNAVKTLEGLSNANEAMQTLAGQVVQIEENKQNIASNKADADAKLSELGQEVETIVKDTVVYDVDGSVTLEWVDGYYINNINGSLVEGSARAYASIKDNSHNYHIIVLISGGSVVSAISLFKNGEFVKSLADGNPINDAGVTREVVIKQSEDWDEIKVCTDKSLKTSVVVEQVNIIKSQTAYSQTISNISTINKSVSATNGIIADVVSIPINKTGVGYILTNVGIGNKVDINSVSSNVDWDYYIANVKEGAKVRLTDCYGGNNSRLWAFVDENDILIDISDANKVLTGYEDIEVPTGANRIIINNNRGFKAYASFFIFKDDNLKSRVEANQKSIEETKRSSLIYGESESISPQWNNGYYVRKTDGALIESTSRNYASFQKDGFGYHVTTRITNGSVISVVSLFKNGLFVKSVANGPSEPSTIDVDVEVLASEEWDEMRVCTGTEHRNATLVKKLESITANDAYKSMSAKLDRIEGKTILFVGSSSVQRLENDNIVEGYKLDRLTDYDIVYSGVGGENMQAVVARLGSMPFYPIENFTIPSDLTSVGIGSSFKCNDKTFAFTNQQGSNLPKLNPVCINGVWGDISLSGGTFYFTRQSEGKSVDVVTSDIIMPYNVRYRNNVLISALGYNGNYDDTSDYVSYHKAAIEKNGNSKYILITRLCDSSWTNTSKIIEEEQALSELYGSNVLKLREWLSRFGMSYAISLGFISAETETDISDRNNGVIPTSLRGDGVHLNDIGYKVMSFRISEMIKELF